MKFILVVLLAASPAAAVKPCAQAPTTPRLPCAPDFIQRKEIMALIGNATGYYKDWSEARERERDLRDLISIGLSSEYSRWKDELEKAEKAKSLLETEFVKITAKTQAAYRVGPQKRSGWVTGGLFENDKAVWNPIIVLEDTYYEVKRPNQPPVYLQFKNKSTTLAATLDDGNVIVTIAALRRAVKTGSPASLAATFEHEGSHFDDLVGSLGFQSRAKTETRAYRRLLQIAEDIGLPADDRINAQGGADFHAPALVLQGTEEEFTNRPFFAAPGSNEYPYIPVPDTHQKSWGEYQERLAKIAAGQKKLHDDIAAISRGERPSRERDPANGPPPPRGATSQDGCGGTGFLAGDVYMPAMPCPRALNQPADTRVIPAVPPTSVPAATIPPPVRALPSLSGLAGRICANPAAVHSQAFHDDYRAAWFSSSEGIAAMPKCQREVFLILMRIRQEGSPDYNSDYFQAFAENLNMPQAPVFIPPEPDVDLPIPPGPNVPDCMRAEGRRCIRWR